MFGDNLKRARIAAGLTQYQLARQTGLTENIISKYENGQVIPPLDKAIYLSNFFHTCLGSMTSPEFCRLESVIPIELLFLVQQISALNPEDQKIIMYTITALVKQAQTNLTINNN